MDIQGKVFIVTGGASGLGEGTARMLAAQGGKVVIADMQAEKCEAVAKEMPGLHAGEPGFDARAGRCLHGYDNLSVLATAPL